MTRRPGLDWILLLAVSALVVLGTLLVWSATSMRVDLTGPTPTRTCASRWSTSPSASS